MSAAAECFWGGDRRLSPGRTCRTASLVPAVLWPRSPTYPKGPEAEDNDDEVHGVRQEHKHVHVSDGTVVGVDEVVEELPDGHVELQGPMGQMPSVGWVEMQDLPETPSLRPLLPSRTALPPLLRPQDTSLGAGAPALTQTLHKFTASLPKHNGVVAPEMRGWFAP